MCLKPSQQTVRRLDRPHWMSNSTAQQVRIQAQLCKAYSKQSASWYYLIIPIMFYFQVLWSQLVLKTMVMEPTQFTTPQLRMDLIL